MNNIKIYIILCSLILFLSGCGEMSESNSAMQEQNNVISNLEDDMMEIDYTKVSTIKISSPVKQMYRDSLDIEIAKEYVDDFVHCVYSLEQCEYPFESEPWYSISIISDESEIDKWRIDCSGVITNSSGVKFTRSGDIDSWLRKIESDYSVSMNLLSSEPGENYFGLSDEINTIVLYKTTYGFSSEKAEINVDSETAAIIKDLLLRCEIQSDSEPPSNIQFTLVLYGHNEEPLYKLLFDTNGKLYTSYGYLIGSSELVNTVNSILQ